MKRFVLAVTVLVSVAACGGQNPYAPAATASSAVGAGAETTVGTVEANTFIPDDKNLSDCVSTLPQPNCGSAERGTRGTYLTMLFLVLGVAFIGWRVSVGIRARDRVVNADIDQN